MALKKVLVISDTYSMPDYPAKGLYVKEQALCLVNGGICKIDILYIKRNSAPFLKCLSLFIRRFLFQKIELIDIESQDSYKASYFFIPINRRIPDMIQLLIEKFYLRIITENLVINNQIPDLIHAHSVLSSGIFSNWISRSLNVPFVITEHSPLVFHFVSKQRGVEIIDAFKSSVKVVSLTFFQDQLLKRYYARIKSVILPNLINESKFFIDSSIKKEETFKVISVLNFSDHKCRDILFESFKLLIESQFKFRYVLVGEGIELMRKECEMLGISDFGDFFFNIPNSELYKFYNSAHLFVSSSIFESHGMAAREAMLCGVPVLTTDNGGIVDSINEDTGLVVSVQDAAALAEGVQIIYNNYHKYEPFKIRERIVNECGKDTFRRKMYEFYGVS